MTPPEEGWWQKVIDAETASFDAERLARERIYEEYRAALDPPQQQKFIDDPSVRPNPMLWKARFDRAVTLSLAARGVSQEMLDDAYHFSDLAGVPPSLRSERILGELIHAAWQFDYLAAEPLSTVLAEFMFAAGALPDASPPIRQKALQDYRRILVNDEEPSWLGAAKWAFGAKQRPDILDFTKRRIIEIKPVRGAPAGVLQLWRYTHNFNCARRFDELTKAGAVGDEPYALEPVNPGADFFGPIDLNEYMKSYFEARDEEKDRGSSAHRRVPARRRRVGRGEVERSVRAGRRLKVVPFTESAIPGLVMYLVHDENKPEERPPEEQAPSSTGTFGKVVMVVTTVVLVTAVLVAIVLVAAAALPAAAGAATATAALGEGAAVAGASVGAAGAEAAVIETFGAGFRISEFAATASQVSNTLTRLGEAGVL